MSGFTALIGISKVDGWRIVQHNSVSLHRLSCASWAICHSEGRLTSYEANLGYRIWSVMALEFYSGRRIGARL